MEITREQIEAMLASTDKIRVKTVFGTCGFFKEEVMFALLSNKQFYLRGAGPLRPLFESLKLTQLILSRRGRPCALHYYAMDETIWAQPEILLHYIHLAIQIACCDHACHAQEEAARYSAVIAKHFPPLPAPQHHTCARPLSK